MENQQYKVIVAHPGRQHSFKLASALKKKGMLFKYITTIYNKDSSLSIKILKKFLSKDNIKRANGRKNNDLSDADVIQFCLLGGYIEAFLSRIDKSHEIYRFFQRFNTNRFGKRVAKYAIKNRVDAVICYDTNAEKCFEILKRKAPEIKRILDNSIITRPYMYQIYNNEIISSGSDDLKKENLYLWNPKLRNKYQKEIELSQYFLAGSDFVKDSIEYCGVSSENIYVTPYGANVESNMERQIITTKRCIHFLFVGQVNYRKGIPYILETLSKYSKDVADLTIVGAYNKEDWFVKKYENTDNIIFTGLVTKDRMQKIYENADVFVIDSFAEGMTQVGIEAMACGLPVIASYNSGLSALVENDITGFLIEPGNIEELKSKTDFFINNPEKIFDFGLKAKEKSCNFSWENYERNIQNIIGGNIFIGRKQK